MLAFRTVQYCSLGSRPLSNPFRARPGWIRQTRIDSKILESTGTTSEKLSLTWAVQGIHRGVSIIIIAHEKRELTRYSQANKGIFVASKYRNERTRPSNPKDNKMNEKDWKLITELPGNEHCMDCHAKYPEWGSVSFGILVCTRCCGMHRYVS